jgi:hypothetical protein
MGQQKDGALQRTHAGSQQQVRGSLQSCPLRNPTLRIPTRFAGAVLSVLARCQCQLLLRGCCAQGIALCKRHAFGDLLSCDVLVCVLKVP